MGEFLAFVVLAAFVGGIILVEIALVLGPAYFLGVRIIDLNEAIRHAELTLQVRYPYDIRPEVKCLQKERRRVIIFWLVVALICWYFGFGPYLHFLQSLNWNAL